MKAVHLAVIAAVLAVAAIVTWTMRPHGGERKGTRVPTVRRTRTAGPPVRLRITLLVRMPDGAPAAGAVARVRDARDVAGADGLVELTLPPGHHDLVARKGDAVGARSFELYETTDLGVLHLEAATMVTGRVFDARGEPIAGATVAAVRRASQAANPDAVAGRASSGQDGAYELALPGTGHILRASAPGFGTEEVEQAETVDFHLFRAPTVSGHVVNRDRRPVEGAHVMLADFSGTPKTETFSGKEGAFTLPVAQAERLILTAQAPQYARYVTTWRPVPGHDLTITLEAGITVRLETVARGTPAPGVKVRLSHRGGSSGGTTDERGALSLYNVPAPDGRRASALLFGKAWVPKRIDITRIEVADGVMDLGEIEMDAGGTVRGVVREAGSLKAVAGAEVRWLGGVAMQLLLALETTVVSDEGGRFELRGVPLGATALFATHPDYLPLTDPMKLLVADLRPIFQEGRTEAQRDVLVEPAHWIEGTVLSPGGRGVEGAWVESTTPVPRVLRNLRGPPRRALSDREGRFRFGPLRRDETLEIRARHRALGRSRAVSVKGGREEGVTLQLTQPRHLSGRVVDEAGNAVAGVRVAVSGTRAAITDDAGRYMVRNVPEGDRDATFDHPRYQRVTARLVPDMTTALPRGNGIEGVVRDESGRPVQDVAVHASIATARAEEGRRWADARSDEQGAFAFFGLRPGDYRLRVRKRGLYGTRPVVSTGTADALITVREAATIRWRVMSRGQPVGHAYVRAELPDFGYMSGARTGEDGYFTLSNLPPDGAFNLFVQHDRYEDATFEGVRASEKERTITLGRGVRIGGVVVDADDRPVSAALLRIWVDGREQRAVRSDEEGRFEKEGLRRGAIEILLTESGQGFVPTDRIAVTAGDGNLRLVARRGEAIEGVVVGADGRPRSGVRVEAIAAGGDTAAGVWVWKEDGLFALRGLVRGVYTLRVRNQENEIIHEQRGVAAGARDVSVRLR